MLFSVSLIGPDHKAAQMHIIYQGPACQSLAASSQANVIAGKDYQTPIKARFEPVGSKLRVVPELKRVLI
jgi:hypothetical protein